MTIVKQNGTVIAVFTHTSDAYDYAEWFSTTNNSTIQVIAEYVTYTFKKGVML
jgi:uncharacterized protein YdiU (UPF0061 family)